LPSSHSGGQAIASNYVDMRNTSTLHGTEGIRSAVAGGFSVNATMIFQNLRFVLSGISEKLK
jgi:hypothetical protein